MKIIKKIIEKSRKKMYIFFPTGGAYTPYIAMPLHSSAIAVRGIQTSIHVTTAYLTWFFRCSNICKLHQAHQAKTATKGPNILNILKTIT